MCQQQECLKIITRVNELIEHGRDMSLRCNEDRGWFMKGFTTCPNIEEAIKFRKSFQERAPKRKKGRLVTVNFAEAMYVSKNIIEKTNES